MESEKGLHVARTDAAKKADAKYKAEKTTQLVIRFYPKDADILEHLRAQGSKQGYIKRLIREDMGAWYGRNQEATCRACGYAMSADEAAMLGACPRCGHGQE